MSLIRELISKQVRKVAKVYDYYQIFFADGTIVTIDNDLRSELGALSNYKGAILNDIRETEDLIIFKFNNGRSIVIGISDMDFKTPEALVIHFPDGRTIVWN